MDDIVYVVSYSNGEYSNRYDWPVAWYATQAEAEHHVNKFNTMREAALKPFRVSAIRYGHESIPHPDVMAFVTEFGLKECIKQYPDKSWKVLMHKIVDYHNAEITAVPRGTLTLHGLEDAK